MSSESQSSATPVVAVGDKQIEDGCAESDRKQSVTGKECQLLLDQKVNTEEFIRAIEGHPSIWDVSSDDYSNKHLRLNAWTEITSTFIKDFDERPLAEKNNLITLVQKRWKSIRACYTRELLRLKGMKSGSAATRKKQYTYFEHLHFLETTRKETISTMDEEETVNIEENQILMPADSEHVETELKQRSRNKRPDVNTDQELIEVLKKKVSSTETRHTSDETNEDKLFLLSMVSYMMKVPTKRKLRLQGEIISLIAAAQAQGWTPESHSYNTVPEPSWQHYSIPPTMHHQPTMHQPSTIHHLQMMNQSTFHQQSVNQQTNNSQVLLGCQNSSDIRSPSPGRTSVISSDDLQTQVDDDDSGSPPPPKARKRMTGTHEKQLVPAAPEKLAAGVAAAAVSGCSGCGGVHRTGADNKWISFASSVAADLQALEDPKQQAIVQKLISDAIFFAKMGRLTEESVIRFNQEMSSMK